MILQKDCSMNSTYVITSYVHFNSKTDREKYLIKEKAFILPIKYSLDHTIYVNYYNTNV